MFGAAVCTFGVLVGLYLAHGDHPAQVRTALFEMFIVLICVGIALALFGPVQGFTAH
jgi:hypothetical protein